MAFFLIVPSVMILSILLIHGVAAHFGLRLKYGPLLLCALGSIAINFIAIKTSPFLTRMFPIKIAVMIVAAAVLITLLNRYLINRDALKHQSEKTKTPHQARVLETEELDSLPLAPPSTEEEAVKRRVEEIKSKNVKEAPPVEERPASRSLVKLINEDKKSEKPPKPKKNSAVNAPSNDKHVEQPKIIAFEKNPSTDKTVERKKITLDKAPSTDKIIDLKKAVERKEKSEPPKVEPVAPAVDKKSAVFSELFTANEKISAIIDKTKAPKPLASGKSIIEGGLTEDELAEVEKHLNSLDDILEFAYAQKNAKNFKLAIFAYQKALERYRADNYAPFIAIDLSSLYKEQAAYTKAIKVCEDALTLPAVVRSATARKEFSHDLAYLRTVQAVLSKHRVLSTPFSKISRQLMDEIDADFKKLTVLT